MKTCCKCKIEKKESDFAKNTYNCKPCHASYMKEWRVKNYEKAKLISNEWKKNNPDKVKETAKIWRDKISYKERRKTYPSLKKRSIYTKKYSLKKLYGMTQEDFDNKLALQNNQCDICKTNLTKKTANIDHNHNNGKVRSLLCNPCNVGIGFFKENTETLKAAILYLEKHI